MDLKEGNGVWGGVVHKEGSIFYLFICMLLCFILNIALLKDFRLLKRHAAH